MSRSRFHHHLANRLLRATALSLALAPAAACGGTTTAEDDDNEGGAGNTGGSDNGGAGNIANAGGSGNTGNQGGAGNTGNQGGAGNTGNTGGGQQVSCYASDAQEVDDCLPAIEAGPLLEGNICGLSPHVISGPTFDNGQCCYLVYPEPEESCGVGRPYLVDSAALAAEARRVGGWSASGAMAPRVQGLSTEARTALADAWLRDALLEHASVASFGRFALELMAIGAPAELVEQAHVAALDEVRHARLCFSLASAYAGAELGPSPFPFGGSAEVRSDLAAIAAAVVREGCIGETLAAAQAAAQLERATDPAVRAVLAAIAEDESRHAELAWRTVAWAVRVGGDAVREAVRRAFDEASGEGIIANASPALAGAMNAHGRLTGAELASQLDAARRDVVRPCMEALLAG
jgi:hypothetical protein